MMNKETPTGKPVILTAEDIKSYLLTPEESQKITQDKKERENRFYENDFNPEFNRLHQAKNAIMDKYARMCGFSSFDENADRNGLRDYTTGKSRKTAAVQQQLKNFDNILQDHEYRQVSKRLSELSDKARQFQENNAEQTRRDILAVTRERMDTKDVKGNPILSPQAYLEMTGNPHLSKKEQDELRNRLTTITADVHITGTDGKAKAVKVDYNLAPYLQRIVDSGYSTGQSDSGTLSDHPYYRYVEDDKKGRYVKGECICLNKQGSSAYLTFWKPEAEWVARSGVPVNSGQQIEDIRRVAAEEGWCVEDTEVFFQPSIRLSLPYTYDGSSTRQIMREIARLTEQKNPGLKENDFLAYLNKKSDVGSEIIKAHGGTVRYSDAMIMARWNKLAIGLEAAILLRNENNSQRTLPEDLDLMLAREKNKTRSNQDPDYAQVTIVWKDNRTEEQQDCIALNPKAGYANDENVVFTCLDIQEFKRLLNPDNGEDFYIKAVNGFDYMTEEQRRMYEDTHLLTLANGQSLKGFFGIGTEMSFHNNYRMIPNGRDAGLGWKYISKESPNHKHEAFHTYGRVEFNGDIDRMEVMAVRDVQRVNQTNQLIKEREIRRTEVPHVYRLSCTIDGKRMDSRLCSPTLGRIFDNTENRKATDRVHAADLLFEQTFSDCLAQRQDHRRSMKR